MPVQSSMFTEREMQVLTAICDTLAPTVTISPDADGLFARKASDLGVPAAVAEAIQNVADSQSPLLIKLTLHLFDQPLINAALDAPLKSFLEMTLDERTALLARWANSPLGAQRRAFQGFKRLALFFFYTLLDNSGANANWPAIHYPGPPPVPISDEKPIKPLLLSEDTILSADVVIIGSGAGGGVVAGELTAAGLDVIVLEKGGYSVESDFDGRELASAQRLFENQGFLTTDDLGVVVLAGSTLGGGTVINWCASFRTPENVLEEWQRVYGVDGFTGRDYQQALDSVAARINVNTDEGVANVQNAAMARGSTVLGYSVGTIPRNVKGCENCGFCNYGCQFGAKQSTLRTYLQDAYQCGARILVKANADRVLIERGQAVGVEATIESSDGKPLHVTIKAKVVVVSAGALHTPAVLMRSGLTNAHIGRNLHLHPTTPTYGLYDIPVQGWSGVMMSHYISEFRDLDGKGYGVTLETSPIHPGIAAMVLSWANGEQHKRVMSRFDTLGNIIVITRDHAGGHITLDKRGRTVLHYTLSPQDSAHMIRGIIEALRIQVAAGAQEVSAPHTNPNVYLPGQNADFEAYLQSVQAAGLHKNSFALLSAHQMSSCRMGANPAQGALDPTGETFEVLNLFVADASALPTATGVNPMLTIMGVSHLIAQHIKAKLGK
ncbi:MAG: GMC family oxidoreductase N-terminal domain-containing protein [Chloroflexota bacterium]